MKPQYERFCENIVKGMSNEEAAIRAGYSKRSAYNQATRLMKNDDVKKRIDELNAKIQNDKIASAQEIQEFLTRQMRGEEEEECVAVVSTGDYCSEATIVKKRITPKDRQKAGETLAKIKQLFNEAPVQPITIVFSDDYATD